MSEERGAPPVAGVVQRQLEAINRFPDQNPNPVMRVNDSGELIYANAASAPITEALGISLGDRLPDDLAARLTTLARDPQRPTLELATAGRRTYALLPVAVPELGFMNVYGTDVTATKVVNKFPDQNPNPVFRVTEDGRLLYANPASATLIRAIGSELGELVPAELFERIVAVADGRLSERIQIPSEGRTYELWPVRVPEFDFINVYPTDVTALKALDKFPDQNPNPVLRFSREAVLLYANPAAQPVVAAFGISVGEVLPPRWHTELFEALTEDGRGCIEAEHEGRIYSLLVVSVYEFGFINLYGTDVTAARQVEAANRENERLLLNILPAPIAERLRRGERVIADRFDDVTLLFADIVDFTRISGEMSPIEVVALLNEMFSLFDELVDRHGLEKIKTIGDAYMVVGGLPDATDDHADRVADMALELTEQVSRMQPRSANAISFRIGLHVGPVVAGVIGAKKFIYDVWGDTVNTASRMESHGVPGRIQVTHAAYERLRPRYRFEPRGMVDVKGKGPMPTYLLVGRQAGAAAGGTDDADYAARRTSTLGRVARQS